MKENELEAKLALLDELQSSCTGCGLCSEGCTTYQATGWEHESPLGRLHLAADLLHGRIHPQSSSLETFDRCLGCRGCEPLCPTRVSYNQVRQIVQEVRGQFNTAAPEGHQHYQKWIKLAYRVGKFLWREYGWRWFSQPIPLGSQYSGSYIKKCKQPIDGEPILAVCCVQDLLQHEVIEQTLLFMERLGCSTSIDYKQPCCGAIFERLIHGGKETIAYPQERKKACSMQTKALEAFKSWMPSNVFFLSRGCQTFIERQFGGVHDLYARIESILDEQGLTLRLPYLREVYYQPYCGSFGHFEKDPIRHLLCRIGNLILRDIPYPSSCCGGYCGEFLLHPLQSEVLAKPKLSTLPEKATIIVTSPDCWGQFSLHSQERDFTMLYPIQILAEAEIQPREK